MIRKPILVISLFCCFWSCKKTTEETTTGNEFPVTEVSSKDVVADVYFVADIQSVRNVEIRARVNGYLKSILVDEGAAVKEGQTLFRIDEEEYQARLNSATADLKSAEAAMKTAQVELERVNLLVQKNVIANTELELAQAKIDQAKAQIDQAKANEVAAKVKLNNTSIRSPFDGVINRIPSKLGSLIQEGDLLTTISDISAMNVYFRVSETDYLKFVKSRADAFERLTKTDVELVLADGSVYPGKGRIEAIESEFEEGTGALALRARFVNTDNLLRHGSSGRIKIKRSFPGALLVPQKSVMEIQDKDYVFTVDNNNMVVMQSFVPLQRFQDYYIVRQGLEKGQRIVYEGVENLREGMIVRPLAISVDEAYKSLKQ
ncbi:MAG: efflux RND transporter periplasmic adaptor subunit [Bacteroidetes bacterium]|nr:efflux RND transporter periplasmic adaptor subunit [Bacteroidota bacterium]